MLYCLAAVTTLLPVETIYVLLHQSALICSCFRSHTPAMNELHVCQR